MVHLKKILLVLGSLLFFSVANSIETVDDHTSSHGEKTSDDESLIATKNEIFSFHNWKEMIEAIGPSKVNENLFLAFVYKDSCQASLSLLEMWKRSIGQLLRKQASELPHLNLPMFVTIPATSSNGDFLRSVSTTYAPTILFLKQNQDSVGSQPSFSTLEYLGLKSTIPEMVQGIIHYLSRLQYSSFGLKAKLSREAGFNNYGDALTVQVRSIGGMEIILKKQRDSMLQRIVVPLDPLLSSTEQEWAQYMLDEHNQTDPLHVICQCRESEQLERKDGHSLHSDYGEFDQIASVLSLRRNVVFCIEHECSDDGVVSSYHVLESNWSVKLEASYDSSSSNHENRHSSIAEFCQKVLRPSILWLDRQMSAPIAFAPFYKLHAVLFVDFHDAEHKENMRVAVVEFRRHCQITRDDDIVCLVVPSTDTRFLSSFGVDMWTQLDQELVLGAEHEPPSKQVFPVVVITDQRQGFGAKRFYLDDPFSNHSIAKLFDTVMAEEAEAEIKSASYHTKSRENSYGVHLLTGATVESFVSKKDKSKLLLFYSPTCGHCKRFNLAWNALGELIDYVGLSDKLEIGRFDVTANEYFLPGVRVYKLPDIYYFGFDSSQAPSRYDGADEVGGISDPLDIIEWWLDVAKKENTKEDMAIDELALLQVLEEQRNI
jgi:hypothetical protein